MKYIYIILLLCLCYFGLGHSQTIENTTNTINSHGKKDGIWIDPLKDSKVITFYKCGVENGPKYQINKDGSLYYFGQYKNGKLDGIWYFFNVKQNCYSTIEIINAQAKIEIVQKDINKKVFYEVEAEEVNYYSTMALLSKGKIVIHNDINSYIVDGALKYGIWRYYDNNGKIIKEKDETGEWD
ncbi:hypothetical protein [Paludibacter jiangxiensis]|uniref:MORN repeat-containing protein n=1 Tax=Paludibacter jiangxiensis TaxID=681398 RepID=A0A161LG38_9BACT|nr:hypothetical protein [Paludibacter jiangxiensis]GAT64295.1 hypothetical protein PJIAN_4845 [Paludibacter jiangxiensis]